MDFITGSDTLIFLKSVADMVVNVSFPACNYKNKYPFQKVAKH